jgi:hypothetical protein
MVETPKPEITVQDVFFHKQETQQSNFSSMMLGFQGNPISTSAIMTGIPGVTSIAPPINPINPGSSKAVVLSMGVGRKFIIGFIDQDTTRIATNPGETTIYSSYGNYTQYLQTGIKTICNSGPITIKTVSGIVDIQTTTYPTTITFKNDQGYDALISAYNDLSTKYNLLLDYLSNTPTTNGKPSLDQASASQLQGQNIL